MPNKVKVAVVQAGTVMFDTASTLEKADRLCEEAARDGAALVVFPEAFIGGYPKGCAFGTVVGSRTDAGRAEFRRYYEGAIEEHGPEAQRLGEMAQRHAVDLVIGVVERAGGTLYCTVLFFSADGRYLGKHRKLMPTAQERIIWGQGDGSTLPVISTQYGVLGAVICWENYMPLLRTAMYAKGVNIWCAPTVDDRDVWSISMRHIALEGRCFVLSACQYTETISGGSVIVSPLGKVLAEPLRGREGILVAEIDMNEIAQGKFDLDCVGHYSRPDVFQLSVNERGGPSVQFVTS